MGVVLAPLAEKLEAATAILGRICKGDGSAVVSVGSFRLLPLDVRAASRCLQLVLHLELPPAPPDGVELDVVRMRRVAKMVGVADGRLVELEVLAALQCDRVNDLLSNFPEPEEVIISELGFLVAPGPRQVVLVLFPDAMKKSAIVLGNHIFELHARVRLAKRRSLRVRAVLQRRVPQGDVAVFALARGSSFKHIALLAAAAVGPCARRIARTRGWRSSRRG
mmetsp:Transcript_123537/g.349256  ORF Transcript_123537/g.349256 Transcript_123537/m.349256 type:complete len:222 (-) Transcript_123537:1166-1831(-)